jgi:hypothetical protein
MNGLHSLDEVSAILGKTTDDAFRLVCKAVYIFNRPVEVSHIASGEAKQVKISGPVIINVHSLEFGKDGRASLFGTTLEQGGKEYLLYEKRQPISKSDIFITSQSLKDYMLNEGYDSIIDATSSKLTCKPAFDMADYIKQNRETMPEDRLVYELRENGCTNNQIYVGLYGAPAKVCKGPNAGKNSKSGTSKISRIYNKYKNKKC